MDHNVDFDRFGDVVAAIGSREFGQTFYDVFRELIDVEECTVFSFPDPTSPSMVVVEGRRDEEIERARKLASDYISGGFLHDPNIKSQMQETCANVYVTNAHDIFDAEYRKHYYDGPSLTQELVVWASVRGTHYYTSFYRRKDGREFSDEEVTLMKVVAGFMVKVLHRHNELVRNASDSQDLNFVNSPSDLPSELRQRTLEYLKGILMSSPCKLSQREAEVCAGIVMGYSTEAIGLNCNISTNTVATHRKRAYAKLGITSQNELFLRYFSAVREYQSLTVQ